MGGDGVPWEATRQHANSPLSAGAHWRQSRSLTVAAAARSRAGSPKPRANPSRAKCKQDQHYALPPTGLLLGIPAGDGTLALAGAGEAGGAAHLGVGVVPVLAELLVGRALQPLGQGETGALLRRAAEPGDGAGQRPGVLDPLGRLVR